MYRTKVIRDVSLLLGLLGVVVTAGCAKKKPKADEAPQAPPKAGLMTPDMEPTAAPVAPVAPRPEPKPAEPPRPAAPATPAVTWGGVEMAPLGLKVELPSTLKPQQDKGLFFGADAQLGLYYGVTRVPGRKVTVKHLARLAKSLGLTAERIESWNAMERAGSKGREAAITLKHSGGAEVKGTLRLIQAAPGRWVVVLAASTTDKLAVNTPHVAKVLDSVAVVPRAVKAADAKSAPRDKKVAKKAGMPRK